MSSSDLVVFVIDDDEDIRSALTRSLGIRGYTVETFGSAQAFLDAYTPDFLGCIILDQGMPGMTGPESVQAMKAGALDFLEKPFRPEVLVDRIEAAFETLTRTSNARQKAVAAKERLDTLTTREYEIVSLMVSDQANTTSKEIARTLDISPRTVDHHRARILEKLQTKSIVEVATLWNAAKDATIPSFVVICEKCRASWGGEDRAKIISIKFKSMTRFCVPMSWHGKVIVVVNFLDCWCAVVMYVLGTPAVSLPNIPSVGI